MNPTDFIMMGGQRSKSVVVGMPTLKRIVKLERPLWHQLASVPPPWLPHHTNEHIVWHMILHTLYANTVKLYWYASTIVLGIRTIDGVVILVIRY